MIQEWLLGFQQWSQEILGAWGYLGVFIVSFIGNATIMLPLPSILAVFLAGAFLNPWVVGLTAGLGAAIGELTGYLIGRGGRKVAEKKQHKWLKRTKHLIKKRGIFPVLVVFAATPLPDDAAGIVAGLLNYDWRKFLLASFIGKSVMNICVAWAGFYGSAWVLGYFGL
ncbi:MAG: VTT domain-containing protein [Candidatus Aenigmatarchaeota archaeon]